MLALIHLAAASLLTLAPAHFSVLGVAAPQSPTQAQANAKPKPYVYAGTGAQERKLYVFAPAKREHGNATAPATPSTAILVFHGGGWTEGPVDWAFAQAEYFSRFGMAGIAVDYRLSDGKGVTPLDADADARDAIRWVRAHADELSIDPHRIVVYGESAGGQLAAATAISPEHPSKDERASIPDALILFSPVLHPERSEQFRKLAGAAADVASVSLPQHLHKGMPPTLILGGDQDAPIPPASLREFCDAMNAQQNRCEVKTYKGVGHMLWPTGDDEASRARSGKAKYDAFTRILEFLRSLGYIEAANRND